MTKVRYHLVRVNTTYPSINKKEQRVFLSSFIVFEAKEASLVTTASIPQDNNEYSKVTLPPIQTNFPV